MGFTDRLETDIKGGALTLGALEKKVESKAKVIAELSVAEHNLQRELEGLTALQELNPSDEITAQQINVTNANLENVQRQKAEQEAFFNDMRDKNLSELYAKRDSLMAEQQGYVDQIEYAENLSVGDMLVDDYRLQLNKVNDRISSIDNVLVLFGEEVDTTTDNSENSVAVSEANTTSDDKNNTSETADASVVPTATTTSDSTNDSSATYNDSSSATSTSNRDSSSTNQYATTPPLEETEESIKAKYEADLKNINDAKAANIRSMNNAISNFEDFNLDAQLESCIDVFNAGGKNVRDVAAPVSGAMETFNTVVNNFLADIESEYGRIGALKEAELERRRQAELAELAKRNAS